MNRLNLVCLGVKDLAKSLAFYKSIGFETPEGDDNPPIVFFNNQGSKLELYPLDLLAEDIDGENPPPLSAGAFPGITLACVMKNKQEVDDLFALVAERGGEIVKMPEKPATWNGYSGYFRDPDGYYWEVACGPNWTFDENDMVLVDD